MDRDNPAHGCAAATTGTPAIRSHDESIAYAREHRYRIRNLHDGGSVPPAMPSKASRDKVGYVGDTDRYDAIVGHRGYIVMDDSALSVCLFYKSALGVNRARARLEDIGGRVVQVGDAELSASVPKGQIEDALKLIKVSKRANNNPTGNPVWRRGTVPEHVRSAESI